MLEFATDPSVAESIVERLWPWGPESSVERLMQVGSLLPEGFEAYARILHPAYRGESNIGTVRWSTVAELNTRRSIHAC